MKKKNIINLIKYYSEGNDSAFRNEAYRIAEFFDTSGDYQLAEYIMALMTDTNVYVPQSYSIESDFLEEVTNGNESLPLPTPIQQDIVGVINAINMNMGINKFLFQGAPGTGKTESVKQIARILDRKLLMVNSFLLIDSKLGQTQKNINKLFTEINNISNNSDVLILFDELDSLALDRTNSNDLREMGRVTSSIFKELDRLSNKAVIIATTNLYEYFDNAFLRRFDYVVDFNRYEEDDLLQIAEMIMSDYLNVYKRNGRNIVLFRKIIKLMDPIPYPGILKNLIRTSIAFSEPEDNFDYLRRLYTSVSNEKIDMVKLNEQGFSLREIEILTGISKSQVARILKD